MMNLLSPTTLQQQLNLYTIKTRAETYLYTRESCNFLETFLALIQEVAPDILEKVQYDITMKSGCLDLSTQAGLNSYLRMFYLSLPFDTHLIREYIIDGYYDVWVRYFVNILLFSFIEYNRGLTNEY